VTIILLAVFWGFASLAEAYENVSFTANAAFNSRYVWRGIRLTDCWVFQPSITLDYSGLSFDVWGNMDLGNANDKDFCISELDYTLGYFFAAGSYSFSLGVIFYNYPNTVYNATTELYLNLGADLPLSPSICVFREVDEADGTYVSLNLEYILPLKNWHSSFDLDFSLGIGTKKHNEFYYGVGSGAVADLLLGVNMPFQIREGMIITPSLSYTTLLDGEIRRSFEDDRNVIFGLTFSTTF